MLETLNWLVVIYSGYQIAEPRDPQCKDHCHKRDWLMVVALFAPPLLKPGFAGLPGCPILLILRADHNVPEAQLRTSRLQYLYLALAKAKEQWLRLLYLLLQTFQLEKI